jgi:hypothetical protein
MALFCTTTLQRSKQPTQRPQHKSKLAAKTGQNSRNNSSALSDLAGNFACCTAHLHWLLFFIVSFAQARQNIPGNNLASFCLDGLEPAFTWRSVSIF